MKLETEHGVFEAETEADVLKLSRAAARDAKKRDALIARDHKLAYAHAYAAGYGIYCSALQEGGPFRAHRMSDPRELDCPTYLKSRVTPSDTEYLQGDRIMMATRDGQAPRKCTGSRCVGILEDINGFTIGIVLEDIDNPTIRNFYAVGVAGEAVALADIQGVNPNIFVRKETV